MEDGTPEILFWKCDVQGLICHISSKCGFEWAHDKIFKLVHKSVSNYALMSWVFHQPLSSKSQCGRKTFWNNLQQLLLLLVIMMAFPGARAGRSLATSDSFFVSLCLFNICFLIRCLKLKQLKWFFYPLVVSVATTLAFSKQQFKSIPSLCPRLSITNWMCLT